NNQVILPPSVSIGKEKYPDRIPQTFRRFFRGSFYLVDGPRIAQGLGNIQAANVVLLGAFSNFFPELPEELWISAIRGLLRESLHDLNINAFREGRKAISS
ncbi:MAG: 2-oxoacid:acceptor oxidoreductase family protein, partial [Candidatus Bathyarchaeia archaeon]